MTVLQEIVEGVLQDLERRRISSSELDDLVFSAPKPKDALQSLKRDSFSVIAEVKRSSPSKGSLAQIPQPELLAKNYENAGAAVVSVLTEGRRFGGSLADLKAVRGKLEIPVLRKDFIVNEYLVRESRAYGADLLLLIVAALDSGQLKDLYQLGESLGMQILVEVHDERELELALDIEPKIIGVNSRNLKSLEIDLANFSRLIPQIPDHIYRIAESGISTVEDARLAWQAGANAILVGESLVKSGDPESAISNFLNIGKFN